VNASNPADHPAPEVCVIGSLNLDLVARVERLPKPGETVLGSDYQEHPGGKGANQAVAAARAGARTAMVGAVGSDEAGRQLRTVLADEGIDTSALVTAAAPTGRALIGVDPLGENSIMVVPGANGSLDTRVAASVGPWLRSARVVLMQLEIPLDVIAAVCAELGPDTLCVVNPAPAAVLPPEVLRRVDVLVPNEHELTVLGGVDALVEAGVNGLLITEGARGARLREPDGSWHRIEPWSVTPIDTTAAGDAFCGVFAAYLARGVDRLQAARAAAIGGALATTVAGAVPSLPRAAQIEAAITTGA
jgi:ribokinase